MKIEELNFSVRTYNCLRRGKIETVEQLREKTDDDLMAIRCFGASCLKEVHQKLGQKNHEAKENTACGGCQIASGERQAAFRLGQMDMKESVIALLEDRQNGAMGIEKAIIGNLIDAVTEVRYVE